jgi:integrase
MLSANFTKDYLAKVSPVASQRLTLHDTRVAGLILRVEPSGTKTFCWLRKADGRVRFKRIGSFPDMSIEQARGKASEHNASLARWSADDFSGTSPFEKRRADLTLNEVIEDYCERRLSNHAKNPTAACKRVRWSRDFYLQNWKTRRLSSITRKNILDLHASIGKKNGKVTANRIVTMLRTLYNWALNSCEWRGVNPASRIERFAERSRERYLLPDEAKRLFAALSLEPSKDLRAFVVIALFTGARRNDILSMRWADVNFETTSWTIPDPKSRTPYIVPLMPEVVEILNERRSDSKLTDSKANLKESPYVFPGVGKTGHLTGFKHSWPELLKRAKLSQFRIHDLRRTLGSWMATAGESLPIIGKSLGHATSLGATSIYARIQNEAVRKAMERATQSLLTSGKST